MLIMFNGLLWFTVSKAFSKSINTPLVCLFLSSDSFIIDITSNIASWMNVLAKIILILIAPNKSLSLFFLS